MLQRDPANELLARGPRFRLDAEMVRDSALCRQRPAGRKARRPARAAVSAAKEFGKPSRFRAATREYFKPDHGDALYRRTLYTFWKRTAPPPSLMTFDAPTREACVVRRARTNTPLQALVLMNDKQYVEAARKLAERVMTRRRRYARRAAGLRLPPGHGSPRRAPTSSRSSAEMFQTHLAEYQGRQPTPRRSCSPSAKRRRDLTKLDPAELAAYTMAANLILNLDETMTKE